MKEQCKYNKKIEGKFLLGNTDGIISEFGGGKA